MTAGALALLLAGWPGFASAAPASPWREQLAVAQAHELSRGEGVVVGLVDTAVDPADPALAGVLLPAAGFPDRPGAPDGHGTTMARFVHAVAPAARIRPAHLAGGPAQANAALRWLVDQGARVVNISLGGSPGSTAFDEGLRYALAHDVLVVASAGNAGTDAAVPSPADRPGVLAVSPVDGAGVFRDEVGVRGPRVFLAAPGVSVAAGTEPPRSGTSQAAAIVSGVAALVRARHPSLSGPEVAGLLARTARDAGPPGRDDRYGHGIVDPVAALAAPAERAPSWWWLAFAPLVLLGALARFRPGRVRG